MTITESGVVSFAVAPGLLVFGLRFFCPSNRIMKRIGLRHLAIASLVLSAGAVPASAQEAAPLFPVTEVDRDTVPAGTPEAFWAVFGESPRNEAERTVKGEKITFVPLTLIRLPGDVTALVSTGVSDCEAHACAGLNSVHYLRRDKSGADYVKAGEWLDVGMSGTWGSPATRWGWTDAITGTPVLYTEGGGTWQGYSCAGAALTELGPKGPVEIARIPVYYSDTGSDNGSTLRGTITAAEQGRSFTVTYAGSETFSERYVRGTDGTYKLEGKTRMKTC